MKDRKDHKKQHDNAGSPAGKRRQYVSTSQHRGSRAPEGGEKPQTGKRPSPDVQRQDTDDDMATARLEKHNAPGKTVDGDDKESCGCGSDEAWNDVLDPDGRSKPKPL